MTDPRMLRALGHPVRMALLDLLSQEGPLTATQAGERLGETPANCSFHLRTLARYGFVEEADRGHGRARPWRTVPEPVRVDDRELGPAGRAAAHALVDTLHEREQDRVRTWRATRERYPEHWREAAGERFDLIHLTADELAGLNSEIYELLDRYRDRSDPANRAPGSLPVSAVYRSFPLRPPEADPSDNDPSDNDPRGHDSTPHA